MSKNFRPACINATVLPAELQRDREAARKALEEHVASSPEYNRVKRGSKALPHTLPLEESFTPDGDTISTRPKTTTKRKSN